MVVTKMSKARVNVAAIYTVAMGRMVLAFVIELSVK